MEPNGVAQIHIVQETNLSLLRRQNMTIVFIHNLGYYNLKQNKDNRTDMIKLPNDNNIHLSDNVLFKKPQWQIIR